MLATFLLLYKKSLLFRIAYVVTAAIELAAMIPDINKMLAIILAEGLWTGIFIPLQAGQRNLYDLL